MILNLWSIKKYIKLEKSGKATTDDLKKTWTRNMV